MKNKKCKPCLGNKKRKVMFTRCEKVFFGRKRVLVLRAIFVCKFGGVSKIVAPKKLGMKKPVSSRLAT